MEICKDIHEYFNNCPRYKCKYGKQKKFYETKNPENTITLPNWGGIYVFFQDNERYEINGRKIGRIVRVGEASNLNNRLRHHFNATRGSVFAMKVGEALLWQNDIQIQGKNLTDEERKELLKVCLKSDKKLTTTEKKLFDEFRKVVSKFMCEHFSFFLFPSAKIYKKKLANRKTRKKYESRIISTLYYDFQFYSSKNWIGKNLERGMWLEQGKRSDCLSVEDIKYVKEISSQEKS